MCHSEGAYILMADLLSKLRMLDAAPKKTPRQPSTPIQTRTYYHNQHLFPVSLFCDRSHAVPALLESLFGCAFPSEVKPEDILFPVTW